MDAKILEQIIKEWWYFVILFLIIWYSLNKWFPLIVERFLSKINDVNDNFKKSLDQVVKVFEKNMNRSEAWHLKHNDELKRINDKLDHLKK
jgi:hypothetical protein